MNRLALAYVATGIVFVVLDLIWLAATGPLIYRPQLSEVVRDTPRIAPSIAFYVLYVAGLVWFGVRPALSDGRWRTAVLNGALFGLIAYATYDLSNQATLKVWPGEVTTLDLCWGAALSAGSATVGFFLGRMASRPDP
jgi:uncharacterized membrane protein